MPMARNVKALLRRKLTGEQVGRIMIEDMVLTHRRKLVDGETGDTPLTEAEKAALVASLESPADLQRYNEFRYAHEALLHAQMNAMLHLLATEKALWKVLPQVNLLLSAEREKNVLGPELAILTQAQYDAARQGGTLPQSGFIVLPGEKAIYEPGNTLAERYLAEPFLQAYRASIAEDLAQAAQHMRSFYVVEAAVLLTGELLGVPGVRVLVPNLNLQLFHSLNDAMAQAPGEIRREDAREEARLRAEVAALLAPIRLDDLRPTAAQMDAARGMLSLSLVRGNMSQLYALLRQEEPA